MEASSTSSAASAVATVFLVAGAAVLFVGVVSLFLAKDKQLERRLYWATAAVGGLLVSLAALHMGWATVAASYLAILFVTALYAFLRTDYLKIGSRIYSAWDLIGRSK
ncbi:MULTISPECIES: hypothetical protein [Mycolicibacterium]|uniref:Transmembrane protein n=1 Tax=Mycolicibacterium goodii TaxID=134601 RepID=A0ABS6HS06_MYCGD|nr:MULTISPECIES: hypothetical protein [Mycolicibacterium]MBU8808559.1 hypothetical protein [Mycolicibacterium goodii]MBU8818208.1 hypothetical protein [Mycolicibacterium goodii]MBU8825411.1 hypothetical protein [Mycolicibacterium goodii]MBU8837056.1 hypothetical protein [Mycolicibacterium goodii]MCP2621782.1 hypothetical protein [Mycolicibacterium smegmatis]